MKRRPPFFYGWLVVATAAVGLLFGAFPIVVASFGVFFGSYTREFHAGRATISLAFTIHNFIAAFSTLGVGRLADYVGARKVIVPGLCMLSVILFSAKAIGSSAWQLYIFYMILGSLGGATTTLPYSLVISRWFDRRRGLALSLMMVGMGTGAIAMPLIAQRLIAAFGWRTAFAIVGGLILVVPAPLISRFLKENPQRMGLLPDRASRTGSTLEDKPTVGLSWCEIRQDRTFWWMTAAFALVAMSVHGCYVHLAELMTDRGGRAADGALASSAAGFALLLGRAGTGYFLDRYFAPYVSAFVLVSAAIGIAMLATGAQGAPALAGAFLVGLAFGAEVDLIAYLMSRYFGLRSLGTALGFGLGAFVLAGGLGPLIMGFAFDRTSSYRVPLGVFFAATLLAAVLLGRLGPYRFDITRQAKSERVGH